MDENRYAPPQAAVSDIESPMPERPRAIAWAVALLWLSMLCTVPGAVFQVVERPVNVPLGGILIGASIGVALMFVFALVLNMAALRGRSWGRWVHLVWWALNLLGLVFGFVKARQRLFNMVPPEIFMQYAAQGLLTLVALILLFGPAPNEWYRAMKARR
jgi:hypothetical protein